MANYLIKGSGAATPAPARSREDVMHVDDMYRVHIYNKSDTIKFSGYVPEEFNFSLQSSWVAPFESMGLTEAADATGRERIASRGVAVDRALKFAGLSTLNKLATARVWGAPSFFSLELPIFLDAYSSTEAEVLLPMLQLLCMAAPYETIGKFLVPPGPQPSKEVLNAVSQMVGESTGMALPEFDSSEAFTIQIGTFFSMSPAIITNVSGNGDSAFEDATGRPISADMMLTVESYFACTRNDLYKWFGQTPPDFGAAATLDRIT